MPRPRKPRKHRNRGSARLAAQAWLKKHSLIDASVSLIAECGEVVLVRPEELLRVEPTLVLNQGEPGCVVFACRPSGSEDDVLVYYDPALLPAKSRSQVTFVIKHYHQHVRTQNTSAASN